MSNREFVPMPDPIPGRDDWDDYYNPQAIADNQRDFETRINWNAAYGRAQVARKRQNDRDRYARKKAEHAAKHPLQDFSEALTGIVSGWLP